MRIGVPQIPIRSPNAPIFPALPIEQAAELLSRFLRDAGNNALILTGAGVSVDSGIRAYRGPQGSYTVRKTYRPIFFSEFIASHPFRQRYWARSYLGYPPVQRAESNRTHYALSALEYMGFASQIITQNVDRLHHQAAASPIAAERILGVLSELHGSLKHVFCLNCRHEYSRDIVQEELTRLNPAWAAYASDVAEKGGSPSTNPDGDVDLQGRSYDNFRYPDCPKCGSGPIKPSVVFFGENISVAVKARAAQMVTDASAMIVIGSALATYSAFRLVKAAVDAGQPLCVLNLGLSRADELFPPAAEEPDLKWLRIDLPSTDVLSLTANQLSPSAPSSTDTTVLSRLLTSGVTREVDDVREPAS